MDGQIQQGLSTLEWIGVFGSFASIVSIIINVMLGIRNRDLKRQLEAIICSMEGVLASVEKEAAGALSSHYVHREKALKAIQAFGSTGKQTLGQLRKRYLQVKRR